MAARWRQCLTPPLVDGLWFPRYDVDEEALLEAEEADLIFALRLVRKAGAAAYIGARGKRHANEEDDAQRGGGGGGGESTDEDDDMDSTAGDGGVGRDSRDSVSSIGSDMSYMSDSADSQMFNPRDVV